MTLQVQPPRGQAPLRRGTERYLPTRWALGWLAIAFIGFIICFSHSGGGTGRPADNGMEAIGALVMVPSLLCLMFLLVRAAVRILRSLYQAYLNSFAPEHRQAAQAALFAGIFVAEVGIAEHIHHERHRAALQAQYEQQLADAVKSALAAHQ